MREAGGRTFILGQAKRIPLRVAQFGMGDAYHDYVAFRNENPYRTAILGVDLEVNGFYNENSIDLRILADFGVRMYSKKTRKQLYMPLVEHVIEWMAGSSEIPLGMSFQHTFPEPVLVKKARFGCNLVMAGEGTPTLGIKPGVWTAPVKLLDYFGDWDNRQELQRGNNTHKVFAGDTQVEPFRRNMVRQV